jgi:hypothetical protein
VVLTENRLETMNTANVLLDHLITSLQSCVSEVEDTVMEESDAEGEVVDSSDSSLSTDVEPVENMVAIPVPTPGTVVHLLVPIKVPQEFVPPAL